MDHLRVWIWTVTECLHRLQEIWDQDQTDQWDHLQEQKVDQWDHLQVKVDLLQEIWQVQDQTDQWDHLQETWDQDQTDQWDHLQVNQADQIRYLVILDLKVDLLQGIWDHLQGIWVITWDHLRGIWDQADHLQDQTLWLEWKLIWLMPVITMDQDQKDQDQRDLLQETCLRVICLLHQKTIQVPVAMVCNSG